MSRVAQHVQLGTYTRPSKDFHVLDNQYPYLHLLQSARRGPCHQCNMQLCACLHPYLTAISYQPTQVLWSMLHYNLPHQRALYMLIVPPANRHTRSQKQSICTMSERRCSVPATIYSVIGVYCPCTLPHSDGQTSQMPTPPMPPTSCDTNMQYRHP